MKRADLRKAVTWSAIAAAGLSASAVLISHATQPVRASPDERSRPLPGDELIANPLGTFTSAVTIHAAPHDVWSWLAQMGAGRAGWYSYDTLDNGGEPSAEYIVPDFQRLEVGMLFPALPGETHGFALVAFEPTHFLVLDWKTPDGVRLVSWAFVIEPLNGTTRLIVRARGGTGYRFFGLPASVTKRVIPVVRAVHFIMQRKQLLGIAKRAETANAVG